jgi:hypothetical protein
MLPVRERAAAIRGGGGGARPLPMATGQESTGVDMRSITSSARRSTVLEVWAV